MSQIHTPKQTEQTRSPALATSTQLKQDATTPTFDTRPTQAAQRRAHNTANTSQISVQLQRRQASMENKPEAIQRMESKEPLQAQSETAQLQENGNEKPNNTGLPNQLKAGIESMSGISMDHIKVHYNSDKPAQLNAHAYAQGSDIHVAPGQEQHVPHEAWHVVQQAQGRVKPTMQMKMGVPVNDDAGLETEADVMGAKALSAGAGIAQKFEAGKMPSMKIESTAQRFPDTKPRQFKSIAQINQIAGLTDDGVTGLNSTQDGPNTGKLYSVQTALAVDKPAALVAAAVAAGDVGERIQAQTFVSKQKVASEAKTVLNQKKGGVGTQLNLDKAGHQLQVPVASNQEIITAATTVNLDNDLAAVGVPNNLVNINYATVYEGTHTPAHPMAPNQAGRYGVNLRAGYEAHLDTQIHPVVVAGTLAAQANLKFLDPLTLRVKTTYGNQNGALDLDYQFGHDWPGYIVKIKHDNGVGDAVNSDMAIRPHLGGSDGAGVPNTYSNVHDTNNAGKLVNLLDTDANDSKEDNEIKIDAHARLAGEGARWLAVRQHVADLKNGSRFYIEQPNQDAILNVQDRNVWYVDFRSLWLSWEPVFAKKYNITNATFILKLGSAAGWGGTGRMGDKKRSDMGADDREVL